MFHKTICRTPMTTHHVVQRRNDDSRGFSTDDDYLFYLDCLTDAAERHRCAIHAYVLMPDQAQLLVSSDAGRGLSRMMRGVGNRYLEYVNYNYQRNGAFWERGFKSTLIDGERNLLACCRAIESAPVRALLAASPADYRWSSYNHHAHGCGDTALSDHPFHESGATRRERQRTYMELFDQPTDGRAPAGIAYPVDRGLAPGRCRSKDHLERSARRRLRAGLSSMVVDHAIAAA